MNSKLNELLKFPCALTYKVIGFSKPQLLEQVMTTIQNYILGNYDPKIQPSHKGTYHSISVTVLVTDIKQVETLYQELSALKFVRMVL